MNDYFKDKNYSVLRTNGYKVVFSGSYRDAIFGTKISSRALAPMDPKVDPVQKYHLNSDGYRSPEFSKENELVFAGCSFTYGLGIPEKGIWGSIIAENRGLSYSNVSMTGASIPWIVKQLFAYFRQYGNPRILLCLFPGLERMYLASDLDMATPADAEPEEATADLNLKKSLTNFELAGSGSVSDKPKYSKKPHLFEDIISSDNAVYLAMSNIRMLEQYCKVAGIELLWGTWNGAFSNIVEDEGLSDLYDFSSYVSMEAGAWGSKLAPDREDRFYGTRNNKGTCWGAHGESDCDCHVLCHEDLRLIWPLEFSLGTDMPHDKFLSHYGVHQQMHFAERFMERLRA